jgi:hypothetical protein
MSLHPHDMRRRHKLHQRARVIDMSSILASIRSTCNTPAHGLRVTGQG